MKIYSWHGVSPEGYGQRSDHFWSIADCRANAIDENMPVKTEIIETHITDTKQTLFNYMNNDHRVIGTERLVGYVASKRKRKGQNNV